MSSLASVYTLEAFTNHLGPRYFGDKWDTREANLATPKEKLRALLAQCRIGLEDVQSEYDSYMLGLRVRKELTHGRTHEISKGKSQQIVEGSTASAVPPDWQRHCTPKAARRIFEAVTRLIECLGGERGEGKYCWGVLGHGFGWQEPSRETPTSESS